MAPPLCSQCFFFTEFFWFFFLQALLLGVCVFLKLFLTSPMAPVFSQWFSGSRPHVSACGSVISLVIVNTLKIPQVSLHTIVSSVEWITSLKGRSPRWFPVRKTTRFAKTPLVCVTASSSGSLFLVVLFLSALSVAPSSVLSVALDITALVDLA